MKHRCDLKHELRNALFLAPFVFAILYALAWPHIGAHVEPEQVEVTE